MTTTPDAARDVDADLPTTPTLQTGAADAALAEAAEAVENAPSGLTVALAGAGDATPVAYEVAELLGDRPVQVLAGEEVDRYLGDDPRRSGYVARLLAAQGVVVLLPTREPLAADRADLRAMHEQVGVPYVEVHTASAADETAYEVPPEPDLTVDLEPLEPAARAVAGLVRNR